MGKVKDFFMGLLDFSSKGNQDSKYRSRRFVSLWLLTLVMVLVLVLPPVLTLAIGTEALILIDGMQFVTIIMFFWGSYLTSDYQVKKLTMENGKIEVETENTKNDS